MRRGVVQAGWMIALFGVACAIETDPFFVDGGPGKPGGEKEAGAEEVGVPGGAGGGGYEPPAGGGGYEPPAGGGGYGPPIGGNGNEGGGIPGGAGGDPNCIPLGGPGMGTCNPMPPSCGCQPGQACDIATDGIAACYPSNYIPPSTSCEGLGVCEPGYTCIAGCKKFCKQSSDCPVPGAACIPVESHSGGFVPGMKICLDHCQPWDVSSCYGGLICTLNTQYNDFMCYPGGNSKASCQHTGQCAPAHVCLAPEGSSSGTCYKWCRSNGDCAGKSCTNMGIASWGSTSLGVCQ